MSPDVEKAFGVEEASLWERVSSGNQRGDPAADTPEANQGSMAWHLDKITLGFSLEVLPQSANKAFDGFSYIGAQE